MQFQSGQAVDMCWVFLVWLCNAHLSASRNCMLFAIFALTYLRQLWSYGAWQVIDLSKIYLIYLHIFKYWERNFMIQRKKTIQTSGLRAQGNMRRTETEGHPRYFYRFRVKHGSWKAQVSYACLLTQVVSKRKLTPYQIYRESNVPCILLSLRQINSAFWAFISKYILRHGCPSVFGRFIYTERLSENGKL